MKFLHARSLWYSVHSNEASFNIPCFLALLIGLSQGLLLYKPVLSAILIMILVGTLNFRRMRSREVLIGECTNIIALVLMGISYSLIQILNETWKTNVDIVKLGLTFAIFPAIAYGCGTVFYSNGSNRKYINRAIIGFAIGGVIYAAGSLLKSAELYGYGLSHIYNPSAATPWGNESSLNVRSIEQRLFTGIALSAAYICEAIFKPKTSLNGRIPDACKRFAAWSRLMPCLMLGILLVCIAMVTRYDGRLWIGVLVLIVTPYLLQTLKSLIWAKAFSAILLTMSVLLTTSKVIREKTWYYICDQRYSMYLEYLRSFKYHTLTGGRTTSFTFYGCPSEQPTMVFKPGSMMHNVVFDLLNDVGIFPALMALFFIMRVAIPVYWRMFRLKLCATPRSEEIFMTWNFLVVIFIESIFQPLPYSDLSMFLWGLFIIGYSHRMLADRSTVPDEKK